MNALHPLISCLLPEVILIFAAIIILLTGLGRRSGGGAWPIRISLVSLAVALYALWNPISPDVTSDEWPRSLLGDSLVWYARLLTMLMGMLFLLVNRHVPDKGARGEFFSMILFSLAGISFVAMANNLILLFLALELVSVPTYILIGLSRRDIRAQEATGKYFFLGAFAAALLLYGFSFLYGATGTMTLFGDGNSIAAAMSQAAAAHDSLMMLGLLLTLGGLAFKIAAVPLHFYVADVYQGAASPVTGLLGFVPKFAGFLGILRLLSLCAWTYSDAVFWLLWVLAALTMLVGNTLALMQPNVKRMLAYSSVAHSGYMLIAILAGPGPIGSSASPMANGVGAMLFYIAVYGVMNLGAFAALSYFRCGTGDETDSAESLDDLAGVAKTHPWATLALAICVLGLMGFPLTGGFIGKLCVFSSALAAGEASGHHVAMIVLVIVGVLNAAIAAAYYLRILATCYTGTPQEEDRVQPSRCLALRLSVAFCAVFVLAVFFLPNVLFKTSQLAAEDLQAAPVALTVRSSVVEVSQPSERCIGSEDVETVSLAER